MGLRTPSSSFSTFAAAVAVLGAALAGCGGVVAAGARVHSHQPPGRGPSGAKGRPAQSAKALPAASAAPAAGGQSAQLPGASGAGFQARMRALWAGIVSGSVSEAMPAFFPEPAYLQVKAISNAAADYRSRLVAHFALDIAAAHSYLGSGAPQARLLYVSVPQRLAGWVQPGYCYNKVGYWHLGGARLVYEEGGQVRSIGIFSMISWRGKWYVVHLGTASRSSDAGVVDSPALGPGSPGTPGGC